MRLCISIRGHVRPSVRPSVRRSICPALFSKVKKRILCASCAVYPALLVITMPYGRVFFHASAFLRDSTVSLLSSPNFHLPALCLSRCLFRLCVTYVLCICHRFYPFLCSLSVYRHYVGVPLLIGLSVFCMHVTLCLSVSLSICLSLCLHRHVTACPSICLSVYPFVLYPSDCIQCIFACCLFPVACCLLVQLSIF